MSDLKITDCETAVVANPWKPWVFVRLETNEGITGYGEATYRPHPDIIAAFESIRDDVIGLDPFETAQLSTPISPLGLKFGSQHSRHATVLSGIDIAMWDIKAKYLDVPLYELLGGQIHGTELRSYANGWYTDIYQDGERCPELFAEAAEEVVKRGYDALKFDPFGNAWRRMNGAELNLSMECVQAVREAVGPDIDILIEGHKRFSIPVAQEVANRLAEFDITWFEEPVPQEVNALKKVAEKSPVPIATGETMISRFAFPDLIHETLIGINQADVVHVGGITELKRIATLSDAEHVDMAPHASSGPLTLLASMHVDTTIPNFIIQENFSEFAFPEWIDEILSNPIVTEDGYLQIPDGPGLGISLKWETVKENHNYEDNQEDVHTIDLYERGWEARNRVDLK